MMGILVGIVFFCCIQADLALPVPSVMNSGDEWNLLVLGLFIVIGMGAVLVACVRCRRKKRGFEEFKNEAPKTTRTATTVEAIRTEFPIFQALSTPSSPHFQQLDNESSKDSRDDLHIDQIDILDEIGVTNERISYNEVINKRAVEQAHYLGKAPDNKFSELSDETIILTFQTNEPLDDNPFVRPPSYNVIMEASNCQNASMPTGDEASDTNHTELNENTVQIVPSHDPDYESSVKEALRELDIAIGDNEGSWDDDSESVNDYHDEDTTERVEVDNEDHFENVLRQLFIDNMLSSLSSLESEAGMETRQQPQQSISNLEDNDSIDQCDEDHIIISAETEVSDEVIAEVMDIVDSLITECCAQQDNETVTIDKDADSVIEVPSETEMTQIVAVKNESLGKSDQSAVDDIEEGFFTHLPSICQSTPSLPNKKISHSALGAVGGAKQQLFGNETVTMDEGHSVEAALIIPHEETFSLVAKVNEEVGEEKPNIPVVNVEGLHDIDATFDIETAGQEAVKSDHDKYLKDNNATITPVNTPIEIIYDYNENADRGVPGMEADSTFTKETVGFGNFDFDKPSTSKSGWFLHAQDMPTSDDTFDYDSFPPPPPPQELQLGDYDYNYNYEEDDDDDGDYRNKNMDLTFDALRKQLADLLPHAQGAPALDDECGVGVSCESGMSASLLEAMLNNIDPSPAPAAVSDAANCKRPLSPIMEESEEENTTIKTSILNDAKNLDSTSTGCIETLSEAVMGVTRTLMASNDTLFNFEDTLGDRDDLTPTPLTSGFASALSPINPAAEASCLNETYPMDSQKITPPEEKLKVNNSMILDLTAVRADIYSNALDVTSPEQLKTFSEEIDGDHVSGSDASGNIDPDGTYTTNTIEMETCISLNKDEEVDECDNVEDLERDERVSDDSEEAEASSSTNSNVLNRIDSVIRDGKEDEIIDMPVEVVKFANGMSEATNDDDGNENKENEINIPLPHNGDSLEQTKLFLAREIDYSQGWHKVSSKCVDAAAFHVQAIVNPPKLEIDLGKCSTSSKVFLVDDEANNNLTLDLNENVNQILNSLEENGERSHDRKDHHLSGEEDPWAEAPRYNGNENHEAEMLTVFNCDWDKDSAENDMTDEYGDVTDEDDDDSSEEFMYVKGSNIQNKAENAEGGAKNASIWEAHVDQVPIGKRIIEESTCETVEEEATSDGDGEFVPSCWNSTAKPSRSALKSPDKSSSVKRRARNVAFKKQHYHSVYEYPREINPLSPSLSEPTFSINFRDHSPGNPSSAIGDIDGFMISSSTRPFHNNQFLAQCNTWPSENDFSWSQHMSDDDGTKVNEGTVVYSKIPIEWPRKVIVDADADDSEGSEANPAVETMVAESLGELRHTKGLLRLPLMTPPITLPPLSALPIAKDDSDEELRRESSDENNVLPTPSCTGSMDSLSSSSCSDRQMTSFTTFGKMTPQSSLDDTSRFSHSGTGSTDIKLTLSNESASNAVEEEEEEDGDVVDCGDDNIIKYGENSRSRVSDSTDEDSGIENISRKIK